MENKGRMVRLAEYSRDCLKALRAETNIQYEGRQGGTLQLFRTEQAVSKMRPAISPCWKMPAYRTSCWNPAAWLEVEPALAEVSAQTDGGAPACPMMKPETASCLPQNLARMAEQAGVKFRFNTPVGPTALRRRANLRA